MERAGLFKLSDSAAGAFCLACAERLRPVVVQLGSKKTKAVYDDALEAGWRALTVSGELDRIKNLLTALRNSRDVTGDPDRRTFYVKFPLQTLHHALRAVVFDSPMEEAKVAWACSVNLVRDFDYRIRKFCQESSTYPLDELTCEDLENDGIEESLRILASCGGDLEQAREQLRPESQARSRQLQTAASRIDDAGGFGSK